MAYIFSIHKHVKVCLRHNELRLNCGQWGCIFVVFLVDLCCMDIEILDFMKLWLTALCDCLYLFWMYGCIDIYDYHVILNIEYV